jgi:hypothetical protein
MAAMTPAIVATTAPTTTTTTPSTTTTPAAIAVAALAGVRPARVFKPDAVSKTAATNVANHMSSYLHQVCVRAIFYLSRKSF